MSYDNVGRFCHYCGGNVCTCQTVDEVTVIEIDEPIDLHDIPNFELLAAYIAPAFESLHKAIAESIEAWKKFAEAANEIRTPDQDG